MGEDDKKLDKSIQRNSRSQRRRREDEEIEEKSKKVEDPSLTFFDLSPSFLAFI